MNQNSKTQRNRNRSGVYAGVAALLGYTAAVVWGNRVYTGDLPFTAMLIGMLLLSFPAAVYAGYRGRGNNGWTGWTGIFLVLLATLLGTLLGIVFASD